MSDCYLKFSSNPKGRISLLGLISKNVKVSQKRCLGTSIESFTGSSPSEQITDRDTNNKQWFRLNDYH